MYVLVIEDFCRYLGFSSDHERDRKQWVGRSVFKSVLIIEEIIQISQLVGLLYYSATAENTADASRYRTLRLLPATPSID